MENTYNNDTVWLAGEHKGNTTYLPPFQCRLEAKKLRQQSVTGRSETEVLNKLVHRSFFFSLNVKDNARKHTWIEKQGVKKKRSYLI